MTHKSYTLNDKYLQNKESLTVRVVLYEHWYWVTTLPEYTGSHVVVGISHVYSTYLHEIKDQVRIGRLMFNAMLCTCTITPLVWFTFWVNRITHFHIFYPFWCYNRNFNPRLVINAYLWNVFLPPVTGHQLQVLPVQLKIFHWQKKRIFLLPELSLFLYPKAPYSSPRWFFESDLFQAWKTQKSITIVMKAYINISQYLTNNFYFIFYILPSLFTSNLWTISLILKKYS